MTLLRPGAIFAAVMASLLVAAHAQSNGQLPSPTDPALILRSRNAVEPGEDVSLSPEMQYRREEARKNDRKKRMVDTANRLLILTQQLQADLEKRPAVPDDMKRLDEIARLARMVKDQMRN